jgi:hypothetical protein
VRTPQLTAVAMTSALKDAAVNLTPIGHCVSVCITTDVRQPRTPSTLPVSEGVGRPTTMHVSTLQ